MRIAINCRSFLKLNYAGIGRYAYNLVKSLSELDQQNEYWLYAQKKYFDFKRHVPHFDAKNFLVKIDWLGQGIDQTLQTVDIYHSPSPDMIHINKAKVVVTVHDLVYRTYPQGHTQQTIDTTEKQMQAVVERADQIICCSQSTLKDLNHFFPVDQQRVKMVYQGVDKTTFFPLEGEALEKGRTSLKKKGIEPPFLLFVGTIEPRKNLKNLLLAFSILKEDGKFKGKLVVAGMKGWMLEGMDEAVKNLYLQDSVIFPGFVSDDDLRRCYNLAECFVFPSFYEGFGFPIIEAFCCGAAVVTSNVSSCPEIAADGALTVDPYDPDKIAQAITNVIENRELKVGLQKKALKRAQDFSFTKTAIETLGVYQDLFKSSTHTPGV